MPGAQLSFDILAKDHASAVFDKIGAKANRTEQNFNKIGSGMSGTIGKITSGVAGMVGGWQAWDKVMVSGFNRLANLDDARKRLDQMGISTSDAAMLMDGLKSTVEGTAFSLDAGAGAMTGFVSAGVDLDEVNDRLQMTADTAAYAQQPLDDIALIFQKIQTQGRLTAEEVNMLMERGVPALALLADAAGVTGDAMREMISRGEVDAERFFELWETGSKGFGENNIKIEGAAKSMGDTIRGSLANAETAFARMGEVVVKDVVPAIEDLADGVIWLSNKIVEADEETRGWNSSLADLISKAREEDTPWFQKSIPNLIDDLVGADEAGKGFARVTKDIGDSAAGATGHVRGLADVMDAAAAETEAATEAFSAYQDALKASTDPVFALQDAISKVSEAESALKEVRSDSESTTADIAAAEWDLFEALTNADSAAHNSALSFDGMNDVLDDMVTKGVISAETAESLRGQIEETRLAAEDYTGPYTADLLAEIDDPAIRDAKRRLDAVARSRNPRYLAELDRQAEIRARNRLDGVANTRRARITATAATRNAESAINYAARNRTSTIFVRHSVSGGSGAQEFHSGGVIGGIPRAHGGMRLGADERLVIGQTGERILSRRQTEAFDRLVSSMGQRTSLFSGRSAGGGGGSTVVNHFHNHGVIGSQRELERWFAESYNKLSRTSRLNRAR